jgi:hypothetical protein
LDFLLVASSPSHVSKLRSEIDIYINTEETKDPLHHQSLFKPESRILKKKIPQIAAKYQAIYPTPSFFFFFPRHLVILLQISR